MYEVGLQRDEAMVAYSVVAVINRFVGRGNLMDEVVGIR